MKPIKADFGSSKVCSQCNNPPKGIYKVVKISQILPCYSYTHYLCEDCSKIESKNLTIEELN